jgi:NADH-quinone oxidoreductase subunit L
MSREVAHHVHESPPVMTIPLGVLAALTVLAGLALGIPSAQGTIFARFLAPVFPLHAAGGHAGLSAYALLLLSVIVAVAGVLLAWLNYGVRRVKAEAIGRPGNIVHRILLDKYYVDEIYDACFVRPIRRLSDFSALIFDARLIDGIVNGMGKAVVGWAQGMRRVQTGYIANYALTMLLGAVVVLGFLLTRGFLTR